MLEVEPVQPAQYTAVRFFADQPWPQGVFASLHGHPWAGTPSQRSWRLADGLWIVYEWGEVLEVLRDEEMFVKYRPKGHVSANQTDRESVPDTTDHIRALEVR